MTIEEREALARAILARKDEVFADTKGWLNAAQVVGLLGAYEQAAEIVRNHPVASPWIAVGERLPERGQEVLCWCQVYQTLGSLDWDGEWEDRECRAIHPNLWMPIPPTEPTS